MSKLIKTNEKVTGAEITTQCNSSEDKRCVDPRILTGTTLGYQIKWPLSVTGNKTFAPYSLSGLLLPGGVRYG